MKTKLSSAQRATYESLFGHPIARGLQWRNVRSLLAALGDATDEPNGNLKVTRNGATLVMTPPTRRDLSDIQELMKIRHFIERSDEAIETTANAPTHLLVVIDHRQARIYKADLHGTVPQRITPYDPDGSGRHLHNVEDEANGQRKPERKSFYEAIAASLRGAEQILIFGSSIGASSAMEQLMTELKRFHGDIASHIAGSIVIDEQHMTEDQVLARAREFYSKPARVG